MRYLVLHIITFAVLILLPKDVCSQAESRSGSVFHAPLFSELQWRNIGPNRGGRSVAVSGVYGQPMSYYMGSTGGGLWKSDDAGLNWKNISDNFFESGSVGAIAVAQSNTNVIYVGMGEHAVRGVMSSHGDGVYKSIDAGETWEHLGLIDSRHISSIQIHPKNSDIVFVAVQGAAFGPSTDRGIYKSEDGGKTWRKVLFFNETTGAADLSMDANNPDVLYAGMWDHQRYPWKIRSGGKGSGIYKSSDGGESWHRLSNGLPTKMGKVAVDVSPANSDIVYANIEADNGGVFRSNDAGQTWKQINNERITYARAWYYIEIFADPNEAETVYVLNAPMLKSTDGGHTFERISNPHGDQHNMWINPENSNNIILANDGGACVSFNGGTSWSPQTNQPTGQFYRVSADNQFPYHVYGGQQDNSAIAIPNQTDGHRVSKLEWYSVAGGESAFLAFNPNSPDLIYGGSYQGNISVYEQKTKQAKDIMAYPQLGLASLPKDMKYRFNWNAPIVISPQQPNTIYHAANVVIKTENQGLSWNVISPDLTRNDPRKQGRGGVPFINEGAGGENYNTISYLACSPHQVGEIWVGTDDGLLHLTKNEGISWENITPPDLGEALINAIEVSPHQKGAAYIVATKYKFNDLHPFIFYTNDYGNTWTKITNGLDPEDFVRVVREDPKVPGLLYAGSESTLYMSTNYGKNWHLFDLNLPSCPITDLVIHDNDLIASTSGRGFWILDDLSPIQQSINKLLSKKIILFNSEPSYLKNIPVKKKLKANITSAGMLIDYYLPYYLDSSDVLTLEIFDKKGTLIRTFNNKKDLNYKKYEGGAPEKTNLPAKRGINRFYWDFRRETFEGVADIFMMGDYRGSIVAPGQYSIRLSTKKEKHEVSCNVLPDPRLEVTARDFSEQQEVLVSIDETVRKIHDSSTSLIIVKGQLGNLISYLQNVEGAGALVKIGKEVSLKIDNLIIALVQPKQKTFQDVINFENSLDAELLSLRKKVESHNPKITIGAKKRLSDLLNIWENYEKQMSVIWKKDIVDFNQMYRKKGIPALITPVVKVGNP